MFADERGRENRLSQTLLSIAELFHNTILNVYRLFFFRQQADSVKSNSSGSSGPTTTASILPGLFGQALQSCLESLMATFDKGKIPPAWTKEYSRKLLQGFFSESSLLVIWKEWISIWSEAIQVACVTAFSHMKSATEIAHIQRSTLHACMNCNSGDSHTTGVSAIYRDDGNSVKFEGGDTSDIIGRDMAAASLWNEACMLLLPSNGFSTAFTSLVAGRITPGAGAEDESKDDTTIAASETVAIGGLLLWSSVFRKPFITQVEHLLKISCHDVFNRTRKRLIRHLLVLANTKGSPCQMHINSSTLDIVFAATSSQLHREDKANGHSSFHAENVHSFQSVSEDCWEWVNSYTAFAAGHASDDAEMCASAARSGEIFMRAEKVRLFLDNEISTLVKELISPVRI